MLSNERNGFKPTYLHRYFDVLFPPHPHPTRAKVRTSGKPLPSPVTSHILRLPMNLVSRISAFVPTMTCSLPLVPISKPSQNTPTPPSRPMSQIREPLRSDLTSFGVLFCDHDHPLSVSFSILYFHCAIHQGLAQPKAAAA